LWWIESVAYPLTCIVQASAGPFGWPFLMASAQADDDHGQKRQQNPHALLSFDIQDAQTLDACAGSRIFGWKSDDGTVDQMEVTQRRVMTARRHPLSVNSSS
jgi:hypothetical protein